MEPFDPAALDPSTAYFLQLAQQQYGGQVPGQMDPNDPSQQGPLAQALMRMQAGSPADTPPPPPPPPMSAQDLLGPSQQAPDFAPPPQYAQSFGDLPQEQQDRANQESMLQMGSAFGQARPGTFGSALSQGALARMQTQDAAVGSYQKLQDLQYQRDLVNQEQQAKYAQISATQRREQLQAQQSASLYNYVQTTLGAVDPTAAAEARAAAVGGDTKALQDLVGKASAIQELQQKGLSVRTLADLADYQVTHASDLKTQGLVNEEKALGPVKAANAGATAGAEAAARMPVQEAIARYESGLTTARERNLALFNNDLSTARDVQKSTLDLAREEQLSAFNNQQRTASAASQPLTLTEMAKLQQAQETQDYKAAVLDSKGDLVTYEGQQMKPSEVLKRIRAGYDKSGPQLPPGVAPTAPGANPLPVPLQFPTPPDPMFRGVTGGGSTLDARVGTTAGGSVAPAHQGGAPNLATVSPGGSSLSGPPIETSKVKLVAQQLAVSGEPAVRRTLAAAGVDPATIDAYIAEAKQ